MPSSFVTGATGFIGNHLLPRLQRLGPVTALVHKGTRLGIKGVRTVAGDIQDPRTLRVGDAGVVFHMAAISYVPDCIKDPVRAFLVNATGTLHMLEAARRAKRLRRFVYMSTGQVFGPAQYVPIDEDHPFRPVNPYGASKLAGERMVQAYHETYGLPTTIIRPFNVYGPGQNANFVIPTILEPLLRGQRPELGDTRPVRDFTYIDDFIDCLLKAARSPKAVGEVFNVGYGKGHSVLEVATRLMRIAGVKGRPSYDASRIRKGEVSRLVVDNRRARTLLGWKPKVSLEAGLQKTWESALKAA